MIRKFETQDLDAVMQIWLHGNLDAHLDAFLDGFTDRKHRIEINAVLSAAGEGFSAEL